MSGKLDCQLVIEMIGRTWDRQFAQYSPQPDGPLKGAGGYIYIYIYIYIYVYTKIFTQGLRVPTRIPMVGQGSFDVIFRVSCGEVFAGSLSRHVLQLF